MQGTDFVYKPENLIKVCETIEEKKAEANTDEARSQRGLEVLEKISSIDESLINATAISLSKDDIFLASENLYQVTAKMNTRVILEVLRCRTTPEVCQNLFLIWQNNFSDTSLNGFIRSLAVSDVPFKKLLKKYRFKEQTFLKMLDSSYLPIALDEEIMNTGISMAEFSDKLVLHGISQGSLLDTECKRALLAICGKDDYLGCSDDNIIGIVKTYDETMFKRFLFNFLNMLTLTELEPYIKLASFLAGHIGKFSSDNFAETFKGASAELKQRYIDWINMSKLRFWFRGDEKSEFWKKYRFDNVAKHDKSGVIALGMGKYVVLELFNCERGTTYICERDVFKTDIHQYLDTMTQEEIKRYFYTIKDMFIDKRNHYPRWQTHVRNLLIKKQIGNLL